MLTVSVNGESLPEKFGSGYDVVCKQEAFDMKAFFENVTFENYNQQLQIHSILYKMVERWL